MGSLVHGLRQRLRSSGAAAQGRDGAVGPGGFGSPEPGEGNEVTLKGPGARNRPLGVRGCPAVPLHPPAWPGTCAVGHWGGPTAISAISSGANVTLTARVL